jgi:competence ComEA-like helix-hairpin-helix protein
MTEIEGRTMMAAAGVLLLAGLLRLGFSPSPAPPPPGDPEVAASLLAASTRLATDQERAAQPLARGELIDPNRADAVELDRLPGVGPALARRVVRDREENGPFPSVQALVRVPGIGAATLAEFAEHLTVDAGPPGTSGGVSRPGAPLRPAPGRSSDGGREGNPLDVNRAREEELIRLPGIGPALARRIVNHRKRHGPFRSVDDLVAVPGIGPVVLNRIRDHIWVGS